MKKRLLSLLLCLVMVFSLLPVLGMSSLAVSGDEIAQDGTHTGNYGTFAKASIITSDGVITDIKLVRNNDSPLTDYQKVSLEIAKDYLLQKPATLDSVSELPSLVEIFNSKEYVKEIGKRVGADIDAGLYHQNVAGSSAKNYEDGTYAYMRAAMVEAIQNAKAEPKITEVQISGPGVSSSMTEPTVTTAPDGSEITNPAWAKDDSGDLFLAKELTGKGSGTYDLKLQSFTTGKVQTQAVTSQTPTDFVLVIDQSSSMSTNDIATAYDDGVKAQWSIANAKDKYVRVKNDDGTVNYYRVYTKTGFMYEYHEPNSLYVGKLVSKDDRSWFQDETTVNYGVASQYYYLVNGKFYPIDLSVSGELLYYGVKLTYTNAAGERKVLKVPSDPYYYYKETSEGTLRPKEAYGWIKYDTINDAVRAYTKLLGTGDEYYTYAEVLGMNTGMYIRQTLYTRHVGENQLCYRDKDGVEHTLIKANYCRSDGTPVGAEGGAYSQNGSVTGRDAYWSGTLYTATAYETRLQATQDAVKAFINNVASQQDKDGVVPHKIAIVGFSGGDNAAQTATFENTELLTGNFSITRKTPETSNDTFYTTHGDGLATNGIQLAAATSTDYQTALLSAHDQTDRLIAAADALTAYGGTYAADAMAAAKEIIDARQQTTYTQDGVTKDRNTVIIFFSDGRPGSAKSNEYAAANAVVEKAALVKATNNGKTVIYSIGMFGEGDGNPLEYYVPISYISSKTYDQYRYRQDFLRSIKTATGTTGNSYELYYHQWFEDQLGYDGQENDTIADYMEVVSSNYPEAKLFAPISDTYIQTGKTSAPVAAYTTTVASADYRGRLEANKETGHYRPASNAADLEDAFKTTLVSESQIISDSAINGDAVLRDVVDLTAFHLAKPYENHISVKVYKATSVNGVLQLGEEDTTIHPTVTVTEVYNGAGLQVDVKNFDYETYRVFGSRSNGRVLQLEIKDLEIAQLGVDADSNLSAGIYANEETFAPTVSIDSPHVAFNTVKRTYVIDFNAKTKVATSVTTLIDATDDVLVGENGKFVKSGTDVTYQLDTATQAEANGKAVTINNPFTSVDTATVFGIPVNSDVVSPAWNQITTIPASSIYFDDDLVTTITPGESVAATSPTEANTEKGIYTFTFYGTGIDIYCTTDNESGYIQAKCDGANIVTMRNQSNTTRYNVPTISYTGLTYGEHTVTLTILGSSKYKLDGVRVYNPVQDQTLYTDNDKSEEAYAVFLNLREALINDTDHSNGSVSISDASTDALSGTLFVDDSSQLSRQVKQTDANGRILVDEDGNPLMENLYKSDFEAYTANSPKNEIYLSNDQGIIFQLTDAACGGKLWIGLSAPDAGKNSGTVTITTDHTETVSVTSGVDMYYPIELGNSTTVTITNSGTNMISVTNLKITGVASLASAPSAAPAARFAMAFAPVTMQTVRMAANNGVDPETIVQEPETPEEPDTPDNPDALDDPDAPDTPVEPDDPKPGWSDGSNDPTSILKSLFQSLLKSLLNVFQGLGGW